MPSVVDYRVHVNMCVCVCCHGIVVLNFFSFLFVAISFLHTGSLPGFETAEPTDADVSAALAAMAIQDDGSTVLDYFVQAYRAGDFPFYADYAVHRATEPLAGPRQIVVTK